MYCSPLFRYFQDTEKPVHVVTSIKELPVFSCPVIENYVSPHFGGETYCFCPVRLCVTVCQRNSSETTEQNFMKLGR